MSEQKFSTGFPFEPTQNPSSRVLQPRNLQEFYDYITGPQHIVNPTPTLKDRIGYLCHNCYENDYLPIQEKNKVSDQQVSPDNFYDYLQDRNDPFSVFAYAVGLDFTNENDNELLIPGAESFKLSAYSRLPYTLLVADAFAHFILVTNQALDSYHQYLLDRKPFRPSIDEWFRNQKFFIAEARLAVNVHFNNLAYQQPNNDQGGKAWQPEALPIGNLLAQASNCSSQLLTRLAPI